MRVVSIRRILACATVLSSCSPPVLSFLSPQTCSFSPLRHASTMATTSIMKRQAATAVPGGGGAPNGKSEREAAEQKKTVPPSIPAAQQQQQQAQPLPPGDKNTSEKVIRGTVKGATTAASSSSSSSPSSSSTTTAAAKASPIETKTGGSATSTTPVGRGPKEVEASKAASGATAPTVAVRGADNYSTTGKPGGSAVGAAKTEETTATPADKSTKKKRDGLSAAPETTAAEKVLTLLDIGLVDKEEVGAYYEALSELERTTQEAKAAAAATAAAASLNPQSPSSSTSFTPQGGPLSLVPFPALCAALGAAGTHSLHLTGGLDTAISVFGAMAGVALGSLVVIGDDAAGRAARTVGSAVTRSASMAGGAAGRSVTESVSGAAGAAAGAVEEAIVKAPSNLVSGLGKSTSNAVSAAVGSVVGLPGELAGKALEGAKGALQDTSEAVVNIPGDVARNVVNLPGEVARQATQAAGGALQSTSETALNAVKESPKEAAKRLKEAVSAPGETLAAFVKGASDERSGKREQRDKEQPAAKLAAAASVSPASDIQELKVAAPSKPEEQEPEGIPVEELEAKMLSVQKALERFDAVKSRIEEAQTSDTLLETVGMTRSMEVSAEKEKSEEVPAATERTKDIPEKRKATGSRASSTLASKPRVALSERKPIDQNRRKYVAERLLEKASQKATEAKAGLKAAAASARREAEMTEVSPATAAGAGKALQETVASP